MRLTAAILAILILILSCLPCADMEAMPVSNPGTNSTLSIPGNEHSQNHDDIDLCSPFCHCACCAGFSIMQTPAILPQRIEVATSSLYVDFSSAEVIEISLPVWQPPQLV